MQEKWSYKEERGATNIVFQFKRYIELGLQFRRSKGFKLYWGDVDWATRECEFGLAGMKIWASMERQWNKKFRGNENSQI